MGRWAKLISGVREVVLAFHLWDQCCHLQADGSLIIECAWLIITNIYFRGPLNTSRMPTPPRDPNSRIAYTRWEPVNDETDENRNERRSSVRYFFAFKGSYGCMEVSVGDLIMNDLRLSPADCLGKKS